MVTPNFDWNFAAGESARKNNEPRKVPADISSKEYWLQGWDFRDAVIKGDKKEKDRPSSRLCSVSTVYNDDGTVKIQTWEHN